MTDVIPPPTDTPAPDDSLSLPADTPTLTPTPTPTPTSTPAPPSSDLDKIKAAQASRRSRRTRAPEPPPSADATHANPALPSSSSPSSSPTASSVEGLAAEVARLQSEATTARLEMSSLRRNHLHNLKRVTEERDMFASQLAHEQSMPGKAGGGANARRVDDMTVQLRAARTRNADLEAENGALRDDVKQLNFRVQASKTIDAATNGYERIVDDLVAVKLKCAQLQEEKEDLLRINKELTHTNMVLTTANGELETSRSQWVVQCAELEKKRVALEEKVRMLDTGEKTTISNADTSYDGSDLQAVNLN